MIDLAEMISPDEIQMMELWRKWYGWNEDSTSKIEPISIKEIIEKAWVENKQKLFHLLGNNLIISKNFIYEKSSEQLSGEMESAIKGYGSYGRNERNGSYFFKNYLEWIKNKFPLPCKIWDDSILEYRYASEEDKQLANINSVVRNNLSDLICSSTLVDNKYTGEAFTIELKDGKQYVVSKGCKPMKALAKIAEAYDIDGFEDFRICHSLVHNQKKIAGDITLSIHPFDYWTMSDNDCDWDSCMNWTNFGGYRQGTIEMMNSPMVIVAYISSKEPMKIGDGTWSNKKWRQLFIVTKDVILGVKSYPYYNDKLTLTVTEWIKELAETNLGWKYFGNEDGSPIKYNFESFHNPEHLDEDKPCLFHFSSNLMYTDVGCCAWHPMYVGTHIYASTNDCECSSRNEEKMVNFFINYSGPSQCINCGELNASFDHEGCLCCDDCQQSSRCGECGEFCGEDYYMVEDIKLCSECYENLTRECVVCDTTHFKDDMKEIYFKIPISSHSIKKLSEEGWPEPPENCELFVVLPEPIYVCDICEEDRFKERFLKEGTEINTCTIADCWNTEQYYIDVKDLNTEEARLKHLVPYSFVENLLIAQSQNNYDVLFEQFYHHCLVNYVRQNKKN